MLIVCEGYRLSTLLWRCKLKNNMTVLERQYYGLESKLNKELIITIKKNTSGEELFLGMTLAMDIKP